MPLHRCRANKRKNRFFHPDYTVGTGFAPVLPFGSRTRGCSPITAGGESHPALKQIYIGYYRVRDRKLSSLLLLQLCQTTLQVQTGPDV